MKLILKPREIQKAIEREGVTITYLANHCNVSRSTLYRYIQNPGTMPVSVWAQMVKRLNITHETVQN